MNPVEFYLLAQRLLTSEPNPAGFRTSISRAYYAAFLEGVAFLLRMGIHARRDASGHEDVIRVLNNSGDSDLAMASTILADLRDHRNAADYRLNDPNPSTLSYADLRSREAGDVMTALTTCRTDGARFSAARVAARTYARGILGLAIDP
jgi:uncharacterized protein (UPF0332 family)